MSSGSRAARAAAAMMVFVTVAAIASVASASSGSGRARSLEMGKWTNFGWDGGNGAEVRPSFEFQSEGAVVITITDAYCPGDRLAVWDRKVELGKTSVPQRSTCRYKHSVGNPNKALEDPAYSSGMFAVGGGRHVIRMIAVLSPFRGGSSFIRADPMTTAMCTDGGWGAFRGTAGFKNQGDCISFVNTS
jgi:hypothetical protein